MRSHGKPARVLLAFLFVWQTTLPGTATGGEVLGRLKRLVKETTYHGKAPKTGEDCAMELLAENIDWLEHHIDTYGSIVAKQPDIWGEARLTKHREEYEGQMYGMLNQFQANINASIRQSDVAFFAQAFALSAAASGTAAAPGFTPTGDTTAIGSLLRNPADLSATTDPSAGTNAVAVQGANAIGLEPVTVLDQMNRYLSRLHELRRRNEGDDTADSPGYALNLVRVPVSLLPGKLTRKGFGGEITITAEPVLTDDLLPTTFRNLVINDVVDQLGLPVVRLTENQFTESIVRAATASRLVGEANAAFMGIFFGEEEYSEELCCRIVNQVLQNVETHTSLVTAADEYRKRLEEKMQSPPLPVSQPGGEEKTSEPVPSPPPSESFPRTYRPKNAAPEGDWERLQFRKLFKAVRVRREGPVLHVDAGGHKSVTHMVSHSESVPLPSQAGAPQPWNDLDDREELRLVLLLQQALDQRDASMLCELIRRAAAEAAALKCGRGCRPPASPTPLSVLTTFFRTHQNLSNKIVYEAAIVPTGRGRRASNPLSPSSALRILGVENLDVAREFFAESYSGRLIRWAGQKGCQSATGQAQECRVDLLDAQRWLREEIAAAYELLSTEDHVTIFDAFAKPGSGLADAIASAHLDLRDTQDKSHEPTAVGFRKAFFDAIHNDRIDGDPRSAALGFDSGLQIGRSALAAARTPAEALAWAIVVESALLNERLNADVRKVAVSTEKCIAPGRKLSYFLPDSVNAPGFPYPELTAEFQEASSVFQNYVAARWPIHVFATEPVTQDQNVADASARRRELQFALALGFANGQIGANSLTQFSRELQTNVDTIGLNSTIVGFGHGSDTFGWRYYPRVQGLDAPGTFGTLRETFLGTSRDYDLGRRRIEPGARECVAIVLMPTFVPYVDFHIRANWFKLTNPKNAALTMKDTLRLSRAITTMRNNRTQCVRCEHLYRPLELQRMLKRVDQLDEELPLQSTRVSVPYENTLGGFEMFNTGVTDLAPELIGWYGAPGVVVGGNPDFACPTPAAARAAAPAAASTAAMPACTSGCTTVATTVPAAAAMTTPMAAASAGSATRAPATPPPTCPTGGGTTMFLVGDNFSVHDTRVIAGGVCISEKQLVSRDIMRVTIPSCVNTVNVNGEEYVAVYAATPYGVTNHLHIPIHSRPATPAEQAAVSAEVTRQISALGLPTQPAMVRPAGDNTTMTATATPRPGAPGAYDLTINQDVDVRLSVPSDPRLFERPVKLYAAVRNGNAFLTSLVSVTDPEGLKPGRSALTIPALGYATLPNKSLLHQELENAIELGTFANGRSVDLRIVYYMTVDGQPKEQASKLREEVRLTVTRSTGAATAAEAIMPGAAAPATNAPTPAAPGPPAGTPADPPAGPLPAPGSGTKVNGLDIRVRGCDGCGTVQVTTPAVPVWPASLSVDSADNAQPRRLPRVPARFVQQSVGAAAESVASPSIDARRLTERLDRIEAALQQNVQQRAVAPTAAPTVVPVPVTPAGSTVNVRVMPPASAERGHGEWWDPAKHPIATQTATRWRERWHNVRDQLPRQ